MPFVGVMYAVALGLLTVSVQSSFGDVENAAVTEASAAGDLYRTLEGLSDTSRVRIQRDVAEDVDLVIDHEWPAAKKGQESDTMWRHADHLYSETSRTHRATRRISSSINSRHRRSPCGVRP